MEEGPGSGGEGSRRGHAGRGPVAGEGRRSEGRALSAEQAVGRGPLSRLHGAFSSAEEREAWRVQAGSGGRVRVGDAPLFALESAFLRVICELVGGGSGRGHGRWPLCAGCLR